MAQMMNLPQNMGMTDRLVRSALGGMLMMSGLDHMNHPFYSRITMGIGGAFIFYGLTGFDPLLKLFGVTTHPGDTNNVIDKVKSSGVVSKTQESLQQGMGSVTQAVGV